MIANPFPRRHGFLLRTVHRVSQFVRACTTRHDPALDNELRRLLADDRQWALLARLPHFDRVHHLQVYRRLVASGHSDPDLLRAALLHDIGKADQCGRVMLAHRVARVLLKATWPDALARITSQDGTWLTHGLYLAEHHARLGADLAREGGASERCCELILQHDRHVSGADAELAALVAADDGHAS